MGAWIGQARGGYWLQDGIAGHGLHHYAGKPCKNPCGFDSGKSPGKEAREEMEESKRRMVQLMLGPCSYLNRNGEQPPSLPTQLDLLNAPLLLSNSSSSLPLSAMESTPIELEPDSPLPSGWEKCLDLKTGSIYYVNRGTGLNSSTDPRKAHLYHGKSARGDLNSWPASPTSSELTKEATVKSNTRQTAVNNMNEKCGGDEGALDLNLSLYVGQSPSERLRDHVSVSAKGSSSLHPAATLKASSSVPCVASSSSSITSPPINLNSISMSGTTRRPAHPSEDMKITITKQDSIDFLRLAPKESPFCGGSMNGDHPISWHSSHNVETYQHPECQGHGTSNAPMVTVACANCLMFVMLSRSNPKCPRCGICPDQLEYLRPPHKRAKLEFSF